MNWGKEGELAIDPSSRSLPTTPQPLIGKRILVTRAAHQAGRLAEALEGCGAEVLRLATIEIIPPPSYLALDAALRAIQSFDWLILTSANGVTALDSRVRSLQLPPDWFAGLRVAAIGPATAAALERMGLPVDVMPQEYVAEAVVAALKDKVPGMRILLVRAAVARDVIPRELTRCGAHVEVAEAYRTIVPVESIGSLHAILSDRSRIPDAVTFTSSSTVNNFFALLHSAEVSLSSEWRAVSIGPVTTRTLREHNWEPAIEAARYDIPGLVEACERLLGAPK